MNGTFVHAGDIEREQLDWGGLGWITRPANGARLLTVLEVLLEPGHAHDFHRHLDQEEVIVVQSGEIEQWLGEERTTLGPGEAVLIPAAQVHASFNTGSETARLVVALSPCVGDGGYELEDVSGEEPWRSAPLSVRAPETDALARELGEALGEDAVVTDPAALAGYAADTYWKALAAQAAGAPLGLPDVAVLPADEAGVAATLRVANERRIPVVPRGGGSGSQGGAVPVGGGILLDLTRLDRILAIDEESLTVTAEAGVNGLTLEQTLNERGLMLPHYPASVDLATVGGYVAARGSGVLSTRYGKIEDLVLSLRVVLAGGETVETLPLPRHAVGPDLTQLFVGSEGTLGVISTATLQLAPLPAARRFETVSFGSVPEGIAVVRSALARGLRPSVVRMYDEHATRSSLGPVVGAELDGVCTLFCFEGEPAVADAEADTLRALARESGAALLGGELGETWWARRYDFYKPPHHPQLPAIWGTIEAVASYARILDVYREVKDAVEGPYADRGLSLKVHFSHWYPWGTMMYGRFVIPDGGPDAVAVHDRIWEDAVAAILRAGGLMNDHHGVGLKLAPYMRAQHGAALDVLRRIKEVLDPNRIMNPGKLDL